MDTFSGVKAWKKFQSLRQWLPHGVLQIGLQFDAFLARFVSCG
jgi:hypothetical protein